MSNSRVHLDRFSRRDRLRKTVALIYIATALAYQASVVETTIAAKGETIGVTTWIAQGVGTVKVETQVYGAGTAGLSTSELLSFTKVKNAIGDGS